MSKADIVAAGAVVLRRSPEPQVLMVHRPRYDDWSLPKGKLDRGEQPAACAVREVAEETGVRVRLTGPLGTHSYPTNGLTKQVHWWIAEVVEECTHTPDDEVDEVRWLPVQEAADKLTYPDEAERLRHAVAQPRTVPLVIMRHAKALPRNKWTGIDEERPLSKWGRRQSQALVPVLDAFGVRRVLSSSAVRCADTVWPFARSAGLDMEFRHELTEEQGEAEPAQVLAAMAALCRETARTCEPTVVCGHRPVLPTMLAALGLPDSPLATAELVVAQLTAGEQVHSAARLALRIRR